jgi:hypothetical protein
VVKVRRKIPANHPVTDQMDDTMIPTTRIRRKRKRRRS